MEVPLPGIVTIGAIGTVAAVALAAWIVVAFTGFLVSIDR